MIDCKCTPGDHVWSSIAATSVEVEPDPQQPCYCRRYTWGNRFKLLEITTQYFYLDLKGDWRLHK